jgi:signal transduction histidine kinase
MGPLPIRLVLTLVTALFFAQYVILNPAVKIWWLIVLFVMFISYMAFIWLRKKEWGLGPYSFLIIAMCLGILGLHVGYPDIGSGSDGKEAELAPFLLWPLIWLLASISPRYAKHAWLGLVPILATILLLSHGLTDQLGPLIGPTGLYFGVRGITSLKESYSLSKQHLEELRLAHEELQDVYAKLQEASVQSMRYAALSERTRLARDIHDGIGHHLTSLIVQLQALQMMLDTDSEKAASQIPMLIQVSRKAMEEVRSAVREWNDDQSGIGIIALKGLVGQAANHSSIHFQFECNEQELPELPIKESTLLYRILQEAITNIIKHSGASHARITLNAIHDQIVMTVYDDGIYTETTTLKPDFGMRGMKSRCEAAGGAFSWGVNHPNGLKLQAVIPVEEWRIAVHA